MTDPTEAIRKALESFDGGSLLIPVEQLRALLDRLDSAERERDALHDVYEAEKAVSRCFDEVSPGLSSEPSGHQERLGAAIERRKECVRKVEALRVGAVGGEG